MNPRRLAEFGLYPRWRARAAVADTSHPVDEREPEGFPVDAPVPVEAESPAARSESVPAAPTNSDIGGRSASISLMDWAALEADIVGCRACALHRGRRQAVPGVGDRDAAWLFVGEGPGAEEDAKGEPFVGQAGRLLDNMLKSVGLARGVDVYIANVVKCRPPQNRTPTTEESTTCGPYLHRQIALIRPALIVALGKTAASFLLETDASMAALRGRQHRYRGIPVIVTYHPAYLLRKPLDKARVWDDLCLARETHAGLQKPGGDPI